MVILNRSKILEMKNFPEKFSIHANYLTQVVEFKFQANSVIFVYLYVLIMYKLLNRWATIVSSATKQHPMSKLND